MAEETRARNGLCGSHTLILSSFTSGASICQGPSQRHRRIKSAPLSSQSFPTSFSQGSEGYYGKPEHGPQASVNREGQEQSHNENDNISIEELTEGDVENAIEADILRPDMYEDAESVEVNEGSDPGYDMQDNIQQGGIIERFRTLHCGSEEDELAAEEGREQRRKRRSAGIFKRSHSQIIGNDTDEEPLDSHGLDRSARRLRRRVRGPGHDVSLEGAPVTEDECEEVEDVVPLKKAPNESDMEEYSTGTASTDVTEDAMDID